MRNFIAGFYGFVILLATSILNANAADQTTAVVPGPAPATTAITLTGDLAMVDGSTTDLSKLSVQCVTLATPATSGTGANDGDGSFSITLDKANSVDFACFVVRNNSAIATFEFQNLTDNTGTSAIELSASADLGVIAVDTKLGTATVVVNQTLLDNEAAAQAAHK